MYHYRLATWSIYLSVLLALERFYVSFQYPSAARCDLLVITFVDSTLPETMSFIEPFRVVV